MGLDIDREDFEAADFERFGDKLKADLRAFAQLLDRPGFGQGPGSLGAELEVHLVDRDMRPMPINTQVRGEIGDERITLELNRYNLEFNAHHTDLAGAPFAALRAELEEGLRMLKDAARAHDGQVAVVGILPTLEVADLASRARTDLPRYNALSKQMKQRRGGAPFEVRVNGDDPLKLQCDDVTMEGAATAWQLHLRVPPEEFARRYNAAQLATGPLLAVGGNSPFFAGHRLWHETRIALFKHAVDDRVESTGPWRRPPRVSFGHGWVRDGACELFQQTASLHGPILPVCGQEDAEQVVASGGVPLLEHMRLHHGTAWGWNRAVYDAAGGGHLRIEVRSLPAGPTIADMLANSAFVLGLMFELGENAEEWMPAFPFEYARHNLYRAAQSGLDARLLWPTPSPPSPRETDARHLVLSLLDAAAAGLQRAGIDARDSDPLLEVIRGRAENGQTGSAWQRQALDDTSGEPAERFAEVLRRYLEHCESGEPVHLWK